MPEPAHGAPDPDPRQQGRRRSPRCPGCGAHDAKVISLFGQQAMTMQFVCRRCGTPFEAIKYDDDEAD